MHQLGEKRPPTEAASVRQRQGLRLTITQAVPKTLGATGITLWCPLKRASFTSVAAESIIQVRDKDKLKLYRLC
jgi:hypothetical protein